MSGSSPCVRLRRVALPSVGSTTTTADDFWAQLAGVSSTRRFSARPAIVLSGAIGSASPSPCVAEPARRDPVLDQVGLHRVGALLRKLLVELGRGPVESVQPSILTAIAAHFLSLSAASLSVVLARGSQRVGVECELMPVRRTFSLHGSASAITGAGRLRRRRRDVHAVHHLEGDHALLEGVELLQQLRG